MLAVLLLSGISAAGCIGAMQTTATQPVGTAGLAPTLEDKDAGLVGITPGFDLKRYPVVAVQKFAVDSSDIKDDEDRKLANSMPDYLLTEVVRQLRATGVFTRVVNLAETPVPSDGQPVLRVEGRISRLAPGSRALRYLVGFGAGRSKAETEFHFIDVTTGRPVLVTADRRVAAYGMFGGDSEDHLRESFSDMARDLARFLTRLSRGEAPRSKQ